MDGRPSAADVGNLAVERRHRRRRQQVAGDDPGQILLVAERAADRGHGWCDDRLIERGEQHRQKDATDDDVLLAFRNRRDDIGWRGLMIDSLIHWALLPFPRRVRTYVGLARRKSTAGTAISAGASPCAKVRIPSSGSPDYQPASVSWNSGVALTDGTAAVEARQGLCCNDRRRGPAGQPGIRPSSIRSTRYCSSRRMRLSKLIPSTRSNRAWSRSWSASARAVNSLAFALAISQVFWG